MITTEKIEEWIKEAEERPASAPLIIQHIANRLRHLSQRNEELVNENIALMTDKRVEEYERRIAHLEYQLDLLKRQFGGEFSAKDSPIGMDVAATAPENETSSIFVYDTSGRIARFVINQEVREDGDLLAQLQYELAPGGEAPHLLAVPSSEELLFVFSSGRVSALPVEDITPAPVMQPVTEQQIVTPDEPRGSESLVCLLPVSKLALVDFFVQISRKGYAKKIGASMAESILANQYIGSGVILPADQMFYITLCHSEDQLMLVSRLGYLLRIEVMQLSYAIDETMRLGKTDHIVSAFMTRPDESILIVTQSGKLIHRLEDSFETTSSLKTRGEPVFSKSRREQGVRVVSAAAVNEKDWGIALHADGRLTIHAISELFASGTIPVQDELLAFTPLSFPRSVLYPSSEE